MSAEQNGWPIHWWVRRTYDGSMAVSACGQMVRHKHATTDLKEVTCKAKGCVSAVDEAIRRRAILKKSP